MRAPSAGQVHFVPEGGNHGVSPEGEQVPWSDVAADWRPGVGEQHDVPITADLERKNGRMNEWKKKIEGVQSRVCQ